MKWSFFAGAAAVLSIAGLTTAIAGCGSSNSGFGFGDQDGGIDGKSGKHGAGTESFAHRKRSE